MYAENKKAIPLKELNWNEFINLQKNEEEEGPLIKIPFSINTPYLQKQFDLDLIIHNLSNDTIELGKKIVSYVLQNFNKLFETGWTLLYYYLCDVEAYPDIANHTLSEFYKEIDFDSPYYSIQLEINIEHLKDGIARYCFVVSTACDEFMISDDDMRVYMVDNKCKNFDTNNDDTQMLGEWEEMGSLYGDDNDEEWMEYLSEKYRKMEQEGFEYAESFQKFELD